MVFDDTPSAVCWSDKVDDLNAVYCYDLSVVSTGFLKIQNTEYELHVKNNCSTVL